MLTSLALPVTAFGADLTIDPARVEAIAALLPPKPAGVGRPIADRAAWEALAKKPQFEAVVKEAEELLGKPLPQTTDELFLDYSRTGNRRRWETVNQNRRGRVSTLALAECLENKGRFVPALTAVLESLCAERTWVMPAHDRGQRNLQGEQIDIDLGSSNVGWTLATTRWLLGDALPPSVRELVGARIRERILDPFRAMANGQREANGWVTTTNNWNAVCLAGVTGAALATVERPDERAFFVAAAEKYSKSFLAGFTADGYCSEGVGYWNYGFGHYLLLGEMVLQATGGRVDLLADEQARRAALYGTKIEIAPGVCPAFADCNVEAQPASQYLWYISRKWELGMPVGQDADPARSRNLIEAGLFAFGSSVSQTRPAAAWPGPGERTWFENAGILIGRPGPNGTCRLAVALKGGHNAEHHNHNDVGSYVVVVDRHVVLLDPGAEVYTARTFSNRRYESRVLNSFGHPVPRVAGKLQQTGAAARGRVLRTEFTDLTDTLALDISSAYEVPALEKLERTFVYSRDRGGSLTVTDQVAFKSPQAFGTAMITFGPWRKLADDQLRIEDGGKAVVVTIQSTGGKIELNAEEIREDLVARRLPTRIGIDFAEPLKSGRITLTIAPATSGS